MATSRNRGFIFGPLVVMHRREPPGGSVIEPATVWGNGLLHRGFSIRLMPWRRSRHESRYLLGGPALVLAWRI